MLENPLCSEMEHKRCCACHHQSMLLYRNVHSRAGSAIGVALYKYEHVSGGAYLYILRLGCYMLGLGRGMGLRAYLRTLMLKTSTDFAMHAAD